MKNLLLSALAIAVLTFTSCSREEESDNNNNAVTINPADFDSSVVRDTTNVLNAYKSGKLGGVPNLGDYYIDLDEE